MQDNLSTGIEWHRTKPHFDLYLHGLPVNWPSSYKSPVGKIQSPLNIIKSASSNDFTSPISHHWLPPKHVLCTHGEHFILLKHNSSPIYIFWQSAPVPKCWIWVFLHPTSSVKLMPTPKAAVLACYSVSRKPGTHLYYSMNHTKLG